MPTPQVVTIPLHLDTVPPLYRRGQHALILVRNQAGNFILGSKEMYPDQISRMVGGGLDRDEDPATGAARELEEELHLHVPPHELQPLAIVVADITHQQEKISFTTWLYYYQLQGEQQIQPDDDLDGVAELTQSEVEQLIERYSQLEGLVNKENHFAWVDYGALYGPMHQIALQRAVNLM